MGKLISGAEIVFKVLEHHKVEHIFGYPGGAVLPIYDELKNHKTIKHILARHEQGAGHAAEGYARSSGKPGVLLVTSGPGATNAVTALTDAYMDSVPLVCISGQVPTHLIGTDAFQECDTTGITRPCTKHNYLVKDVTKLFTVTQMIFWPFWLMLTTSTDFVHPLKDVVGKWFCTFTWFFFYLGWINLLLNQYGTDHFGIKLCMEFL